MNFISSTRFSRKDLTAACFGISSPGRVGGLIVKVLRIPSDSDVEFSINWHTGQKLGPLTWPVYEFRKDEGLVLTGEKPFVFENLPLELVLAFALIDRLESIGMDNILPELFRQIVDEAARWEAWPAGQGVEREYLSKPMGYSHYDFILRVHRFFLANRESSFLHHQISSARDRSYKKQEGSNSVEAIAAKCMSLCMIEEGDILPDRDRFAMIVSIPLRYFISVTMALLHQNIPGADLPTVPEPVPVAPAPSTLEVADYERVLLRELRKMNAGQIKAKIAGKKIDGIEIEETYGARGFDATVANQPPGVTSMTRELDPETGKTYRWMVKRLLKI